MEKQKLMEKSYFLPSHYFDLEIGIYELYRLEDKAYLSKVLGLAKEMNPQKILDFGCGDGRFSYELGDFSGYVGIDISKRAIAFAKILNPKKEFISEDILEQKFDKKFDLIVAIEVIEHLNPEKRGKIIRKLESSLKSGGHMIVTVPSKKLPLQKAHYQHFNKEELDDLFSLKNVYCLGHNIENFYFYVCKFLKKICILTFPIKFIYSLFYSLLKKQYKKCSFGNYKNAQRLICIYRKK